MHKHKRIPEETVIKILSCYGNVSYKSIAKMLDIKKETVYRIMRENGKAPYGSARYNARGERITINNIKK